MSNSTRRTAFIIVLLAILLLLAFLLVRCSRPKTANQPAGSVPPNEAQEVTPVSTTLPTPATPEPAEVLTAATIHAPAQVKAGAVFPVSWTGPNNKNDYLTIVRKAAPDGTYLYYRETSSGSPLELTAPIETGEWEVRYTTARSHRVLGRAPITIAPIEATLSAPAEAIAGAAVPVTWSGPNNAGDYITLVAKQTSDGQYGNFSYSTLGSPLNVTAPVAPGDAELRYMSGQGAQVLARRPIKIVAAEVSLSGPAEAIAGSIIAVNWSGPNNTGDYVTVAARETPDGQYGNYTYTTQGSPLKITVPITPGDAELRYMTGQGAKVLTRRPIKIVAAEVSVSAPAEAAAGSVVTVNWSGPNYQGDYITLVAKGTPDGQYANYIYTTQGSPLKVTAPKEAGDAELRYMSGQGAKVLARRPIKIIPPH